jgi:hypothetical protein
VVSRHLKGCNPHLCPLRTVQLTPVSKYGTYRSHAGDMGPVSLVVGCQQKFNVSPTAPLVVVGENLGTDPRIGWPTYCRLYREPFFSGAIDLLKYVDDCMKGCYMWTA